MANQHEKLAALREINDKIQMLVAKRGTDVPSDLIQALSDLDWLVRNDLKSVQRR